MKPLEIKSRAQALEYLATNANFVQIYQQGRPGRPLDDLGFAQAKRYARGMFRAAHEGREVPHLGALRGHVHTEHHTEGRRLGARKPGYEDYSPPKRVKRGWYELPDSGGKVVAAVRVTTGEREAQRALGEGASHLATGLKLDKYGRRRLLGTHARVAVNVYGPDGQRARLFWRGGWYADNLAHAIGMVRTRAGYWRSPPGMIGLEQWLLDYLASLPEHNYGARWRYILRYEIYFYPDPVREIADESKLHYVAPA